MNNTKQRIASLIRKLIVEMAIDKPLIDIPIAQSYCNGRRDMAINVITQLQAILAISDLDSAEKGCEGSVQDAEGL